MTQAQWYDKIKSSFPTWFFQDIENQEALLQGIAKIFESLESDIDDHILETFILTASSLFLDTHGGERSVSRISDELDSQYRYRVQNLSNQSNKISIKNLVDELLLIGECTVREDFQGGAFVNREEFINRGVIIIDPLIDNTFTIMVDKQLHDPYSFVDREYFCNREDFVGTIYSSIYVLNLIIEAVNKSKALGTLYRVIERA